MTMPRRCLSALAALALLGSAAFPVVVSACAAPGSEAACCCGGPAPCACPRPDRPAPGGPCRELQPSPDASSPAFAQTPELPGAGILPAAPLAALEDATPGAAFRFLRIEPGWDPGSTGLTLPLRL